MGAISDSDPVLKQKKPHNARRAENEHSLCPSNSEQTQAMDSPSGHPAFPGSPGLLYLVSKMSVINGFSTSS